MYRRLNVDLSADTEKKSVPAASKPNIAIFAFVQRHIKNTNVY